MKKSLLSIAAIALAFVACNKNTEPEQAPSDLVIEPVITRALSLNFKAGNKIGLTVTKADGTVHADNAALTYSEGAFSGDLKWYADGGESCTLQAYFPYQASGFPEKFSVELDQTAGTDASDLMFASKTGVYPNRSAEMMAFRHQLSQIVININNTADAEVAGVTIKNLIPGAVITKAADGSLSASVDPESKAADIKAEPITANKQYCVVVIPQEFKNLGVVLDVKGASSIITGCDSAELKPGYSYNISITITADQVDTTIGGEIEDWDNGGDLSGGDYEPSFEEFDGYFIYDGVTYTTAKMKDGKVWMTQNLRYVPVGITPSASTSQVKAGVYYPLVVNADQTAAEFSTDPEVIAANGYLYQTETALGVAVGSIKTQAAAEALNGARGICPKGWHIPTDKDMLGLVGKIATYKYGEGEAATNAPYYDANLQNATFALLNADGFNCGAWGAVTLQDATKTEASLMGWLKSYPTKIASGFVCGSTFAGISYNTTDDPTSGIKNIQFWGFMPMVSNATFNGAKVNFRSAVTVRCVKDSE